METVEALCEKLRPVIGSKADRLWLAYLRSDSRGKREIERVIGMYYSKILRKKLDDKKILLSPPPKEEARGEYVIGRVSYNDVLLHSFGLNADELIQHVAILGRSGSGKTNCVYQILLGLIDKGNPFLCFDWKKNYRNLIEILPEEKKKEILIFTVGKNISPLKYNPLVPPEGTPLNVWLKKLNEIVAHSYYLGDGCLYILMKAVDSVYKQFGAYGVGSLEKWPTMHDVLKWLEMYPAKGREANWMSSTIRAVSSMCYGGMGEVLNANSQEGFGALLKRNCVLELDALTEADKIFFIESLLLWVHHYRLSEGKRETFKHAIIVEEAHHVLNKQKQDLKGGETIVDVILREIRELGESVFIIDQMPAEISNVALANSYCTIAFNTKHQSNVNAVANCMLFEDRSREKDYLGKLPVGTAIVKLQGRWTSPFLLKVPHIKLNKGRITDDDVKEHMADSFSEKQSAETLQEPQGSDAGVLLSSDKIDKKQELLEDIMNFPSSGIFERYRRLELSSYLGNALKEALTEKGLIKTVDIPTSKGRFKILELTTKGKKFLREMGHEPKTYPNGPSHRYWKYRIAKYFTKMRFKATMEYKLKSGKCVDVVVENKNVKVAFEVETGKSDAVFNILKDLEEDFNMIVAVAINEKVRGKITEQLKSKGIYENERIAVIKTKGFETEIKQNNLEKLCRFVRNKVVTIATHYDCDGLTSGALIYHTIKEWPKKISVVTKGVPFEITPQNITQDTEKLICIDIKPSKELGPSKVFYIDHHPNPDQWHNKHSIHDENARSCTELIFREILNDTKNPYLVFLSLLGFFGDGGKLEEINPKLLAKAKQLIPRMLEKHNDSYLKIQRYVSRLNIGMRMLWNADFILGMLCEISSLEDFLSQSHPAHKRIAQLKNELKQIQELSLEIRRGEHIDYAVINCPANIQGMLAAKNLKDRPLLVINTHNGIAVGSLRVSPDKDFDAGQYLQHFAEKIEGLVAGGHKKAAGITLPEAGIKELISHL